MLWDKELEWVIETLADWMQCIVNTIILAGSNQFYFNKSILWKLLKCPLNQKVSNADERFLLFGTSLTEILILTSMTYEDLWLSGAPRVVIFHDQRNWFRPQSSWYLQRIIFDYIIDDSGRQIRSGQEKFRSWPNLFQPLSRYIVTESNEGSQADHNAWVTLSTASHKFVKGVFPRI